MGADLRGKQAIEDVRPSYTEQEFTIQKNGVLLKDNAALEQWLKSHDASQLDEMVGGGQTEVSENPPGSGVSGSREGRPSDGIIRVDLNPEQTFNLSKAYKDIAQANADYNGVTNNCTSYISCGLKEVGVTIKPEAIYDWANIILGNIVTEAQTPNKTYNELKKRYDTTIIKDAGNATNESYEDAVLDKK